MKTTRLSQIPVFERLADLEAHARRQTVRGPIDLSMDPDGVGVLLGLVETGQDWPQVMSLTSDPGDLDVPRRWAAQRGAAVAEVRVLVYLVTIHGEASDQVFTAGVLESAALIV